MTWPLYYKNIASGALNSWKAGDKKPMLSMLGFSAAWFSAMSTIDGFDVPILDGMARYGIAKTPLISPLTSIYDMADRSIGGIVMPQLALVAWPFFEIMDKTSKLLGAEDNAFTWGAE